jgi:hypothetical protein
VLQLPVTGNVVPSSLILVTLMMEVIHSSETSILRRATSFNISEDGILHSHCRENLKSYMVQCCLQNSAISGTFNENASFYSNSTAVPRSSLGSEVNRSIFSLSFLSYSDGPASSPTSVPLYTC